MRIPLILVITFAALASASTITLTFSGTGDGQIGNTIFTNNNFTLVFTTDTSDIAHPDAIPEDWSTPSGTPATFNIVGIATGFLTGNQAVFEHPSPEDRIGIWHYDTPDWLTKTDPAFASYDLVSSLSVATGSNTALPISGGVFTTSAGDLSITSVSALSFVANVSPTPAGDPPGVPEPSAFSLLSLGVAGMLLGLAKRRVR
jgi:hypothetical protein